LHGYTSALTGTGECYIITLTKTVSFLDYICVFKAVIWF